MPLPPKFCDNGDSVRPSQTTDLFFVWCSGPRALEQQHCLRVRAGRGQTGDWRLVFCERFGQREGRPRLVASNVDGWVGGSVLVKRASRVVMGCCEPVVWTWGEARVGHVMHVGVWATWCLLFVGMVSRNGDEEKPHRDRATLTFEFVFKAITP